MTMIFLSFLPILSSNLSTSIFRPDASISGEIFSLFIKDVFFAGFNQPAPINARKPNCCSIERDSNLVLKAARYSFFCVNKRSCKKLRILTYSFGWLFITPISLANSKFLIACSYSFNFSWDCAKIKNRLWR